jgi:hypothetical protein
MARVGDGLGIYPETWSAGLTAESLAREGNAGLREYFPTLPTGGGRLGYALRWRDAEIYSIEPLASSLTFAAFFLPRRDAPRGMLRRVSVHRRVAAEVAALTIAVMGFWLLSATSAPRALLATAIIALGTSHRTIAGAGL